MYSGRRGTALGTCGTCLARQRVYVFTPNVRTTRSATTFFGGSSRDLDISSPRRDPERKKLPSEVRQGMLLVELCLRTVQPGLAEGTFRSLGYGRFGVGKFGFETYFGCSACAASSGHCPQILHDEILNPPTQQHNSLQLSHRSRGVFLEALFQGMHQYTDGI